MSARTAPLQPVTPHVPVLMRDVLFALLPGAALLGMFFGPGVWGNLILAMGACLLFEALALHLRERPLRPALSDGSALVTGALLALALPPGLPPLLVVVGAGFAMLLGKHVFGGLGHNVFNPAMLGYVVLLVSFPAAMSQWPAATLPGAAVDAVSTATPLDHVRNQLALGRHMGEIGQDPAFTGLAPDAWRWINLAFLAGGLYLLWRRVIRWHIPVAVLGGLCGMALLFWLLESDAYPSPLFHALAGGTMLGAFFIATDPVTAPAAPAGRLIYGAALGLLVYVIRTWGGYPDAIAFAVLLLNLATPMLDQTLQARTGGRASRGER